MMSAEKIRKKNYNNTNAFQFLNMFNIFMDNVEIMEAWRECVLLIFFSYLSLTDVDLSSKVSLVVKLTMSPPPVQEQRDEYRSGTPSSPQISLKGPSDEATHEAMEWLKHLFQPSSQILISNNFILHFGLQEQQQLRQMARDGINIEESFNNGHASITVKGNSTADVVVAALQVEAMLCDVMREFIQEEERLFLKSDKEITYERMTVDPFDSEFIRAKTALQHVGVDVVKVGFVPMARCLTFQETLKLSHFIAVTFSEILVIKLSLHNVNLCSENWLKHCARVGDRAREVLDVCICSTVRGRFERNRAQKKRSGPCSVPPVSLEIVTSTQHGPFSSSRMCGRC